MVSTSNEGIMTEVMTNYLALRASPAPDPAKLLKALHLAEAYRCGIELRQARDTYDQAMWRAVPAGEIEARLGATDRFLAGFAQRRLEAWGVAPVAPRTH